MKTTFLTTRPFIVLWLLAAALPGAHSQEIENADFAKGKSGWMGDGEVVYIDAQGEVSDTKKPEATPAIQIELSKTAWKGIRQRLRVKPDEAVINLVVQVKAGSGFKRADSSRLYTSDFKEGGQYGWSAEVYPKCDFLVRVKTDGWQYRPVSLAPVDTWKTVTQRFEGLKGRQREIELLFPPGDGTVLLKGP